MDIIQECLAYFKNIDINFDLLIIADTQNKTTKNNNYIVHTDESEFFSRREFAEIILYFWLCQSFLLRIGFHKICDG